MKSSRSLHPSRPRRLRQASTQRSTVEGSRLWLPNPPIWCSHLAAACSRKLRPATRRARRTSLGLQVDVIKALLRLRCPICLSDHSMIRLSRYAEQHAPTGPHVLPPLAAEAEQAAVHTLDRVLHGIVAKTNAGSAQVHAGSAGDAILQCISSNSPSVAELCPLRP